MQTEYSFERNQPNSIYLNETKLIQNKPKALELNGKHSETKWKHSEQNENHLIQTRGKFDFTDLLCFELKFAWLKRFLCLVNGRWIVVARMMLYSQVFLNNLTFNNIFKLHSSEFLVLNHQNIFCCVMLQFLCKLTFKV